LCIIYYYVIIFTSPNVVSYYIRVCWSRLQEMTVGLPLVSDIAETPRVSIVDSKYTADGKVEPQQRMSPKGKHIFYLRSFAGIIPDHITRYHRHRILQMVVTVYRPSDLRARRDKF